MAPSGPSSIALALAGKTASVDIPKPRDSNYFAGRDTFAAVAARSLPTKAPPNPELLTPPNSISPLLPPHGFDQRGRDAPHAPLSPSQVESDLDLQDSVAPSHGHDHDELTRPEQAFAGGSHGPNPMALEAAGAITPGLLAKHHLPEILLAHGPLAIRHVMGYLTTSVPGFSGIPPAKARRLVVGALEGRGSGREGGGINGDVEFEKVGWGRWDARVKGQPPRDARGPSHGVPAGGNLSPPPSIPTSSYPHLSSGPVPISRRGRWPDLNRAVRAGTSWTGDSAVFSHDEDMDPIDRDDITMLEHEADKMSLDGNESCSSSEIAPEALSVQDEDIGDATDDEDWANIGAAALRQASLSSSYRHRHPYQNYRSLYNNKLLHSLGRGNRRSSSTRPIKSAPTAHHLYNKPHPPLPSSSSYQPQQLFSSESPGVFMDPNSAKSGSGFGMASSDSQQEREAIEALVRLSSV
ncbi:MAG: DNA topoisomerase [Chaenotheca gracillima]|nr:MAG: DNA topoisomerase [Chaenotheca gracillima]